MTLDKERWYVRWFFWSAGIWDEFCGTYKAEDAESSGTNLCFFIRVIFVWAPLVILLHLTLVTVSVAAITYIPIKYFGGSTYLKVLVGVVAVALMILGIKYIQESAEKRRDEKRKHRRYTSDSRETAPSGRSTRGQPQPQTPTLRKVLWEWLLAQKKMVCPPIDFIQTGVKE